MHTPWKSEMVAQIREEMQRWYDTKDPDERGPIGAYCIWWALFTCRVLRRHGIRATLQAGTAAWPRLTRAQDDGHPSTQTHFAYEYEPGMHNALQLADGRFPGMHVWAGVLSSQTLIDVTTPFWPEQCRQRAGIDWPGDAPPDYLWAGVDQWPDGVVYTPDREAMQIVVQILQYEQQGFMVLTV